MKIIITKPNHDIIINAIHVKISRDVVRLEGKKKITHVLYPTHI